MTRISLMLKAGHTVEIITRLASHFEARHGMSVDIEVVSEDEAYDRLSSGHNLPDICTVPYWYLADLVEKAVLAPVQRDQFPGRSHPLAESALSYHGHLWAIPHTLTGGALFIRREMLPVGLYHHPRTFQEFLDMWKDVIHHGSSVAIRAGQAFSSAETYRGLLFSAGIRLFGENDELFSDPAVEALQNIVDRMRRQKQTLTGLEYSDMGALLPSGEAVMMFDTSAWATFYSMDETLSEEVSYGPLGDNPPAPFFYAEGLGITSACADPEAAAALINWRHSPDVIREEVTSLNRIDFPRLDLLDEQWFQARITGPSQQAYDAVFASWAAIPNDYPLEGQGFVTWGRCLMAAIEDAVNGEGLRSALNRRFSR